MTDTNMIQTSTPYDVEKAVLNRYQAGAKQPQASLCCPTDYEGNYLDLLPSEIIEKDYGCGDPTRYIQAGETVLDLGSGAGKNCYIIAQKVGAAGQVIGVDFNDEMLNLSRRYQEEMGQKLGYDNTQFVKGKIQDLKLNLDLVKSWLKEHPVTNIEQVSQLEAECDRLREQSPLIPNYTIDVVISNCVLNLVRPQDKQQLFAEIYRVLKEGGRAIISDIVCDKMPTEKIINDPELWSGCIAGAFREDQFLKMFEAAGFYGIEILKREETPWQVIDGIEFRSMTLQAYKGKQGDSLDRKQSVIYKGPWKQVQDDGGHTYCRGERMAVSDTTFQMLTQEKSPYQKDIISIPPYEEILLEEASEFTCNDKAIRHPQETKGMSYRITQVNDDLSCCSPGECC